MLQQLLNINWLTTLHCCIVLCCKWNALLLFVDAFDELTDKITQFVSNVCLCYSILSLLCKFHSNIPSGCQDIANLPRECFNGPPCVCVCVCVWILFSSYLNVIHKGDDRLAAIHSTYSHLPAEPSWMPP